MSQKFNFELTEVGQNALWKAQNNGIEFELTHIEFGSSSAQVDDLYGAVKLSQGEQFVGIASGNRISETQIRIYAKSVPEKDFPIREIGIWQGEPNKEGSILFAYVAQDKLFGQMVVGIDFIFSYDMIFTTADIDSITIIEDGDTSLVLALIAQHELAYDPHPYYVHKEKDNLIKGKNTFEQPITGSVTGNSGSADKLSTARKIHNVAFDGTKDIEIPVFNADRTGVVPKRIGTTQNKFLCEDGTWKVVDSSESDNAKTAEKLKTARTIGISGAVTGTATSFDGSANITIPTTAVDATKLSGIVPSANLSGTYAISITGNASTATKATTADSATKATTADSATKATTADSATKATTADIGLKLKNEGQLTANLRTGTTAPEQTTGANLNTVWFGEAKGYPINFGSRLQLAGEASSAFELFCEWTNGGENRIYTRSRGDLATHSWSKIKQLAYVEDIFGTTQKLQDMTSQRVMGTTYTNTLPYPIFVGVHLTASSSKTAELVIDGIVLFSWKNSSSNYIGGMVGAGQSYYFNGWGVTKVVECR